MRRLFRFLRGSVRFCVTGGAPEEFINRCASEYLPFWNVAWPETGTVELTVTARAAPRARALAQRLGFEARELGRAGLPAFLGRFRRRGALLTGMALCLCAVAVLSRFILTVEVEGSERVPDAVILTELRRLGLRPGAYAPALDEGELRRELLLRVDGLSWCAVNLSGTRAQVVVREAVSSPERTEGREPGDVRAHCAGIVEHLEVYRGEAAVGKGATVLAGETLITGNVTDPQPLYSDLPGVRRQLHAAGSVTARTWRVLTAEIPLAAQCKSYTGRESRVWTLTVFGKRIKICGKSSNCTAEYDKMTFVWTACLRGEPLPLSLSRETCRAYEKQPCAIDRDAAQTMLEEELLRALGESVGQGEILATVYSAHTDGEKLSVTLTAECREEIGVFVPFS